jgi:hypothetical protein
LAALAILFLALAAAYGLAIVMRASSRRLPRAVLPCVAIGVFLAGNVTLPIRLNAALPVSADLAPVPASLAPAGELAEGYVFITHLPPDAVITELPFGELAYEIRYTYAAARHRRAIVNGYSGLATARYHALVDILHVPFTDPRAWDALVESGTTHVTVHHGAWANDEHERRTHGWLVDHGARSAFTSDAMTIYEVTK